MSGVLAAAIGANAADRGLICPGAQGGEAAWAGSTDILAPHSLLELINHFKGSQVLSPPRAEIAAAPSMVKSNNSIIPETWK